MRRLCTKLRGERGQALLFFVLTFSMIVVAGAIVVDFGLWFSERRGAQKDADASALAGAQAYVSDLADTNGAFLDATDWAIKNGIDPADIDAAPTSDCSPGNSCIQALVGDCREDGTDTSMPWVESKMRHNSTSLFSSIFGVFAPDIGGVARACVGSPRTAMDLSPFGVQTGFVTDPSCPNFGEPLSDCLEPDPLDPTRTRPVYGAACILKTGAHSDDCAGFYGGQRGQLTIGDLDCEQTSASTMRHDFHYGARAGCTVGQDVNTGTGNIIGLLQGLNDRLVEEGSCDAMFHSDSGRAGYDDFDEVFSVTGEGPAVPSYDNVFVENLACRITSECSQGHLHNYQPRVIDLVLIDHIEKPGGGPTTAVITGFAAFYVIGCFDDAVADATKAAVEADLTNIGPFLNRCEHPTGQDDILGIFVQTLQPPINVGDPDPSLPLSIVLVK